jgi:hypothetical protein
MIYLFALLAGWLAGSLAVWTVCLLRRRRDLWARHLFYSAPLWSLPVYAVHWLGWHSLLVSFATYGLVLLALWMDSRNRFPR